MKTITQKCDCGATFESPEMDGWPGIAEASICPECTAKARAEEAAEIQQRKDNLAASLAREVDSLTPPRLRTPDIMHPAFNLALWRKVEAWKPTRERPWLGLIGGTGECKTRCAFLRLRQFALADGQAWHGGRDAPKRDALAISGMDFNRLAVDRYSKEHGKDVGLFGRAVSVGDMASGTLRAARKVDILILDELGKVKSSPGTVEEIFSLIDHRSAHNLITIWTSNTKPEQFCAAWGEEYAAPGCGRILETSTVITA